LAPFSTINEGRAVLSHGPEGKIAALVTRDTTASFGRLPPGIFRAGQMLALEQIGDALCVSVLADVILAVLPLPLGIAKGHGRLSRYVVQQRLTRVPEG